MALGMHMHDTNGRILVVDDDHDSRMIIRHSLEKAGYEVIEAADGEQGIQAMQCGDNPLLTDIIICDIRMPNVNGIEAIEYFRTQFPSVPIIVVTGFPDMHLAMNLLKKGVVEYLVKPVESKELLEAVNDAMAVRGERLATSVS